MKKSTSGTVTIYFVAATAAFVLLSALLIDFARIAAFRKQAELAAKSGIRSTLSSYDPLLYERYGLFIRGGEPANELFRQTLEGNVAKHAEGDFSYLDVEWGETEVTESRPLADHGVFRRQILEEMKYKAPIDLAIELTERFRGVSNGMKEAVQTVNLLEAMRKAYDRRESALDDALAAQTNLGKTVMKLIEKKVPYPPATSHAGKPAGDVGTIVEVAEQYEDYVSKRQEDDASREVQRLTEEEKKRKQESVQKKSEDNKEETVIEKGPRYEAIIAAYESGAFALAKALSNDSDNIRLRSLAAGEEARTALSKAEVANDEMKAIIAQAKSLPKASPAEDMSDGEQSVGTEQIESMEQLRNSAEELILEPLFMDEFASEINMQMTQGDKLADETASFAGMASTVPGSTGREQELWEETDKLQQRFSEYVRTFGADGSVVHQREERLTAHRSQDKERKQEEKKAQSAWTGATNFLGTLTGITGSDEEKAFFDQIHGLYQVNREWNKGEDEKAVTGRPSDPSDGRDKALDASSGLMDALLGSMTGARDQLYFSEYAMSRLSYYHPSLVKEMLRGGETSLDIHMQETEYILYGLNNPAGNIAAAYSEIFAFRLAIRTMEGLIECRSLGHPLLVLAAALVYGITKAVLDLTSLVENGKVQLSKYLKVDTRYEDYLRIFLLSNGGSANQLARTIAVIEHATDLDFRGAYTYASGEVTASVRLWFFPGLLKILGKFGHLGGSIKGNRYEATYAADSSYQ
ncbi:hypothetical protein [Cohnella endophytica]|uniref:hypothetical protein n=1 Tax=Cohnella endophytica TaxID=2419778 RepID=UPI0011C444BB|nr:hypothetical protein [Cohnella endophytica]